MPGWIPLAGDWDGDGVDTVGLYNRESGTFFLKNANITGIADLSVNFGPPGNDWIPLGGDWDGDDYDEIGLYNPSSATFYLKNENISGVADKTFVYGVVFWKPVSGDWDGDGYDTVGVRSESATFYLKNSLEGGQADITANYGILSWLPISGNWTDSSDGSSSITTEDDPNSLAIEEVSSFPNPVSGDKVRFNLEGRGIDQLQLTIYTPSGEVAFRSPMVTSNSITWDLTDEGGDTVSNGIYLYCFTVQGQDGQRTRSGIRKLLILR